MGYNQDYKREAIRSAAILTGSYVAGTVIENLHTKNQVVLLLKFTIGSLTSCEVKIEWSPDGTTYYQETFGSIASTTDTLSLGEHKMTGTGNFRLPVSIKDRFMKVSAKGTGTVTSSSLAIEAVIGNA